MPTLGQTPMKRALDLAIALFGLVVLAAVGPLISLLIRIDSPGPAIFAQTRVGRREHPFQCYKFRTMYLNATECPTHKMSSSEITRIGHFLRTAKIDELPQLYNVIRGNMSLVGPRPCLPSQVQLIAARRVRGVTACLPGITGLAQVMGVDMSDPDRLATIDAEYVKSQSMGADIRIICATLLGRRLSHA
jgi:O-antigen biosynthesis protein WbqP